MSEPFYCMQCGAEEYSCEHWNSSDPNVPQALVEDGGPFCEVCGKRNDGPGCEFGGHAQGSGGEAGRRG